MKKLFTISFLLCLASLSGGQYIGLHGGSDYGFKTDVHDSGQKVGYKIGGTYGYAFDSQFRTELELSYRYNPRKTIVRTHFDEMTSKQHFHAHSLSFMANVLYDLNQVKTWEFVPYFGFGAGYAEYSEKSKFEFAGITHEFKIRDNRFAYQGIIGGKYRISDNVTLACEYHYYAGHPHTKNHSFGLNLVRSF